MTQAFTINKLFARGLVFFPLVFLFAALLSCAPQKPSKDELIVILDSRPASLDPRKATDANGMRLLALAFNGLVQPGPQGKTEPDLAVHWRLEGLTWTFCLKPDLRFSNGRRVRREDILFSFDEFRDKSSPFYSAFKNIQFIEVFSEKWREGKLLEKSGDKSAGLSPSCPSIAKIGRAGHSASSSPESEKQRFVVKIRLKSFQAPFLYSDLPVIKILPKKEILESPESFRKKPLGTGDFKIIKNSFREILLERRGEAGPAGTKRISFQIIRDSLTRSQKMLSKAGDIAPSVIPLQKIPQFERRKEFFRLDSRPGLSTSYLLINLKHKFLQNRELRRALSLSIHRGDIIKHRLGGWASPAKSFIPLESYFFSSSLPDPVFDLEKAQRIVRELGLKGESLKLSSSNSQDTVRKARVLASQMSQTGLKISLQPSEWGAFYKDTGRGAYDLALMKWAGVTDPDIYRLAFHSGNLAPKGRNRSFYENKRLDQLLDQGLRERDKAERKKIYDQIQSIIARGFVVIPLWHDMELSVIQSHIEDYRIRFNGDFLSLPLARKK